MIKNKTGKLEQTSSHPVFFVSFFTLQAGLLHIAQYKTDGLDAQQNPLTAEIREESIHPFTQIGKV